MISNEAGRAQRVSLRAILPDVANDLLVAGITLDSRAVQPGWLYAALPGARTHGARFVDSAVAAGAVAVLTDAEGARIAGDAGVPVVVVDDVRALLGAIASAVYGDPTRRLATFGVTGTNGKTTTVALLAAGLEAAGRTVGTIGTLGFRLAHEPIDIARTTITTPEAPDLQSLLAHMADRGADAVALEVSSHALQLERVAGIAFDVVGFLNLGHDHLDFHKTLDAYFAAKRRLFEPGRASAAVVWTDDEHGAEIAEMVRAQGTPRLVTCGTRDADYVVEDFRPDGRLGGQAVVRRGGAALDLRLSLPGRYNMIDGVVALAMLEAADVPTDRALAGLMDAQVPGRMQRVVVDDDGPLTIVDFAHTPQAVTGTLEALAPLGPLTTVIGCGGDRDPHKRPLMGRAAAELSRLVIVTDDNPRTEDPATIRAATLAGAQGSDAEVIEVPGRAAAIREAIARTSAAGVVAILGKGHERGQILADKVIDFDDVGVARAAWEDLHARGSVGSAKEGR